MHFGDLDFIVTAEGDMAMAPATIRPLHSTGLNTITEALEELQLCAPEARAPRSDQLLDFDYGRLERQLSTFLGPRPSQENLRHLTFSFTNVMAWLARGEPLSLEYLIRTTPTTLLFGLHNAIEIDGHPMARHMPPSPMNDVFVGMIKYIIESFHDLLAKESESPSSSDSNRGSHHPSL